METVERLYTQLLGLFPKNDEKELIEKAFRMAERFHRSVRRKSGEPYILHPLQVALIISEKFNYPDPTLVTAALLHDLIEDTEVTKKTIEDEFGPDIAQLVDGLTKLDKFTFTRESLVNEANAKKLIRSVADDLQVMVVKLADRLNNLSTLHVFPVEKRRRIAQESLEFFALFAKRLGIFTAYTEITDYSLIHYYGDTVRKLNKKVQEILSAEEPELKKLLFQLKTKFKEETLDADVKVLEKGTHSFYDFERKTLVEPTATERSLYRILIVVKEPHEAYLALGYVHSIFEPLRHGITDLIGSPKRNGFQSLFSYVKFGTKIYQFQYRTETMDEIAREGVLYYWKHFGTYATPSYFTGFKEILARLTEEETHDIALTTQELIRESEIVVYVGDKSFTFPEGYRILDLAYDSNPKKGEFCTGGTSGGHHYSVFDTLQDGEKYELLYDSARPAVKNDWLVAAKSAIARPMIQKWLAQRRREQGVSAGLMMLHYYLSLLSIDDVKFFSSETLKNYLDLNGYQQEDLYYRIATGATGIKELLYYFDDPTVLKSISKKRWGSGNIIHKLERCHRYTYVIDDVEDFFLKFPGCCVALPEAKEVKGLLTPRGIALHDQTCKNFLSNSQKFGNDVNISWNLSKKSHETTLTILLSDKLGSLNKLFSLAAGSKLDIRNMNSEMEKGFLKVQLIFNTKNFVSLNEFVHGLRKRQDLFTISGVKIKAD